MDKVKVAQLTKEQVHQLMELENKLNVTLVAYESSTRKGSMEEIAIESTIEQFPSQ